MFQNGFLKFIRLCNKNDEIEKWEKENGWVLRIIKSFSKIVIVILFSQVLNSFPVVNSDLHDKHEAFNLNDRFWSSFFYEIFELLIQNWKEIQRCFKFHCSIICRISL